jgi:hypothetical protein
VRVRPFRLLLSRKIPPARRGPRRPHRTTSVADERLHSKADPEIS